MLLSTREVPEIVLIYYGALPYHQALSVMEEGRPAYVGALMSLTQAQVRQVMRRVLRETPG